MVAVIVVATVTVLAVPTPTLAAVLAVPTFALLLDRQTDRPTEKRKQTHRERQTDRQHRQGEINRQDKETNRPLNISEVCPEIGLQSYKS